MTQLSVAITEEQDAFVAGRIASGQYADANAVVQEALRTLEREEREDDAKLATLRAAIDHGLASGIAEGDVFTRVREKTGLPPRRIR